MRVRVLAVFTAVVLTVGGVFVASTPSSASPADEYTGTHFGLGNIPPGCESDAFSASDNACYHMRTGMNGLDSSDVDVLLMVPASPTAARDMRIMRQAVEMWNGGIHYLAPQMGVPWMKNMHFHISTDIESAAAGAGVVTYPIIDPEIVIIATNPVGGAGIGIDPYATVTGLLGQDENTPCAGVANPFDIDTWRGMPGYDHHDHEPGATVTEDCGGAGGNVCFALTPAIDPAPPALDLFNLFDLVAHEFGHCLTVGHVGDGAEGPWSKVPTNDIMSYNTDPVGLNKCVSTLDVEGIAVTQSHYIDANGDGVVSDADHVDANQAKWDGTSDHFQVQNPRDHYYASGTGAPIDCPQPDLGLVRGTPTNWQPDPVTTSTNDLTVVSPSDGARASDGKFDVTGTVEHRRIKSPDPTNTSASVDDPDNDAKSPFTEITGFTTTSTANTVDSIVSVASLPPTGSTATSTTAYSTTINGRKFDSFIRYPAVDPGPMTWDSKAAAYLPAGTSSWDTANNTVTFHIPRSYLHSVGIDAPYYVATESNVGGAGDTVVDDQAPDSNKGVGIAGSSSVVGVPGFSANPRSYADATTVHFEREGGNHFDAEQSEADGKPVLQIFGIDNAHHFDLNVPDASDVAITLAWTDGSGESDLDLRVTGSGGVDSGSDGVTGNNPEAVTVHAFKGKLGIEVDPYLIADPANGVDYTLTAIITPTGPSTDPDTDGDGVPDARDACPQQAGTSANGCPAAVTEHVRVFLDNATTALGVANIDSSNGPAAFDVPVTVPKGQHALRVEWERFGKVVATKSVSVTSGTSTPPTTKPPHPRWYCKKHPKACKADATP